jgi:hypothetical protein
MCGYSLEEQVEMDCLSPGWGFERLKELLSPHRNTLQELRIRQHGPDQEGLDRFDLQAFEKIRILQLCNLGLPSPDRACDLWLTPNLQRLVFESSWNDSQCGVMWHFSDDDVAWLAGFAWTAEDRRRSGALGLRSIEVICDTGTNKESPMSDLERHNIEANRLKAKGIVESRGFDFVWRTEI